MSRLNHLQSTVINMQVKEDAKRDKWFLWYYCSSWHPKLKVTIYDIGSLVEPRNSERENDLLIIM